MSPLRCGQLWTNDVYSCVSGKCANCRGSPGPRGAGDLSPHQAASMPCLKAAAVATRKEAVGANVAAVRVRLKVLLRKRYRRTGHTTCVEIPVTPARRACECCAYYDGTRRAAKGTQ